MAKPITAVILGAGHRSLIYGDVSLSHPDRLKIVGVVDIKPEKADYAGSTTGIMSFIEKSDAKSFIIGTDNAIVQHMQFSHPGKEFFPLSKNCICNDMRLTTLIDVYNCLTGVGGEEIILDSETIAKARKCIDAMLK